MGVIGGHGHQRYSLYTVQMIYTVQISSHLGHGFSFLSIKMLALSLLTKCGDKQLTTLLLNNLKATTVLIIQAIWPPTREVDIFRLVSDML